LEVGEKCDAVAFILLLEHANKQTQESKSNNRRMKGKQRGLNTHRKRKKNRYIRITEADWKAETISKTSSWRGKHQLNFKLAIIDTTRKTNARIVSFAPLISLPLLSLFFFLDYRATLFPFPAGVCIQIKTIFPKNKTPLLVFGGERKRNLILIMKK